MGVGLASLMVLAGTGVIYGSPAPMPAARVTPPVIAANRSGLLHFCFHVRVLREEPKAVERAIRRRVGDFGADAQEAQHVGTDRFVLQPDGSYVDFYTVAARYNTTAVRLCDDLLASETAGGPAADQIPADEVK